eukprot:gene39386-13204_t
MRVQLRRPSVAIVRAKGAAARAAGDDEPHTVLR